MKPLSTTLLSLLCLALLPNFANAQQDDCNASISLSVQGDISKTGVGYVNANFKSQYHNYAIRGVKPGKSKIKRKVGCGQYEVAATAVSKPDPQSKKSMKAAVGPSGQCTLKVGTISVGKGDSAVVTFPNDFNC